MPFGTNIYLYLDLYLQDDESVKKLLMKQNILIKNLKIIF